VAHGLIFALRANPWERSSGAHRIATFLRKQDIDVEVVDFAAHWKLLFLQEFVKKSVKSTTVFFGFSIFFGFWNDSMTQFTTWLKMNYPHIKIISGGQQVLQSFATNIDIWVDSYGEEAMLAIVRKLETNNLSGITFSAKHFGKRKVIKSLESYPAYNLGDYSIIMEKRDFLEPWEWLTVEFSRGCKFSCAFCNFPVLGLKEDTSRAAENFEYEMRYNYDNFGINRYYVADETFNDRIEKITKFANVVERLDFKPFFSGFIRADLLSQPNMIEELARMNFGGQYYGIETFNHQSGKIIGKGLDPEKVKNLILKTKDYFKSKQQPYRGTISLIVGLPFDTQKNWDDTISWLTENWQDEGIVIFPLVVEIDNKDDYTNSSKFSKNLQKYGLRSLGEADANRFANAWAYFNWKEGGWAGKQEMLWEHDTMNIFQAKAIADKIQDTIVPKFRPDSWCLSWYEMKNKRKVEDWNLILSQKKPSTFPLMKEIQPFIDSYSIKKLQKNQ